MWDLTRRQWATAVVIAFADFCSAVCVSLQAPFYPAEAERKGATASQYGFVLGVFQLTIFVTSPIFGNYISELNPKFLVNCGLFITGACSMLFGVLDQVVDGEDFIVLSFAVRIVEALGSSAFFTAGYSIIAAEFPQSVATTFATLETFIGLGLIVGPTLGGVLYQYGGYTTPFVALGALLIVSAVLAYFLLPATDYEDVTTRGGLFRALRLPSILLAAFSVLAPSTAIGFLSATLEPHLRQFALEPVILGLMFVIEGGIYAVTAPLWGFVCDRKLKPEIVMLLGAVLVTFGFALVGPAPFIPLMTTLPLVTAGLALVGLGNSAMLVASFISAIHEATAHGFPDDLSTYGMVSGLSMSMFALGSFIGPSVAGIMYDCVGFRYSTLFVVSVTFTLAFCASMSLCLKRRQQPLGLLSAIEAMSPVSSTNNIITYGTQQNESGRKDLQQSLKIGLDKGLHHQGLLSNGVHDPS